MALFSLNSTLPLLFVRVSHSLFLLITLMYLAFGSPAEAGHWNKTTVYSGTRSVSGGPPYGGMDPASGSESWTAGGASTPNFYAMSDSLVPWGNPTASSVGSITTTWTWVPEDPNDPGSDPPPANVLLMESGSVTWTTVNKHYEFPGQPTPGDHTGSGSGTLGDIPLAETGTVGNKSGKHFIPKYSSGGSFSHTCDVNVTATVNNSGVWEGSVSVNFGYNVNIRPQPYDFRKINSYVDFDGALVFEYDWKSTTGVKTDLTNCFGYGSNSG